MQSIAREKLVSEIENRLWSISTANSYPMTVGDIQRNPGKVNEVFPCVNVFEGPDKVLSGSTRGGFPSTKREMEVTLEFWIEPDDERKASADVITFYQCIRWALLKDGPTLGLSSTSLEEVDTSDVMVPIKKGDLLAGMGVKFIAKFVDNVVDPTQP